MGLEKLELAAADVSKMQVELVELQPQLIVASKDVDDMVIVIEKESIEVEKVATVVAKDEAVANEQASAAKAIADDCDKDLSRALPILNAALAALDTLTAQVCKQVNQPPLWCQRTGKRGEGYTSGCLSFSKIQSMCRYWLHFETTNTVKMIEISITPKIIQNMSLHGTL